MLTKDWFVQMDCIDCITFDAYNLLMAPTFTNHQVSFERCECTHESATVIQWSKKRSTPFLSGAFIKASVIVGGLLALGTVHAQDGIGGCPPGMIPYSGTDLNSCGPIPPGYYGNQKKGSAQLQPPPQWSRRWGAIVTDSQKGILGTITNMASQSEAEQGAMADCKTKGGAQCKLQLAYDNECAAMILGDKAFNVIAAATVDEAAKSGIKQCSVDSTNCHVYYSACSLPQRIQ